MIKTLRCKACGFIAKESRLRNVCPACGLPRSVFEEYEANISRRRKIVLELNMHPISAHLPQAFVIVIPLLILGSLVTGSKTGQELVVTAKWLSILLPFAVLASMSLGVIDGLTRFKKINTPMLFRKVILGLVLLILSTAMALLVIFEGLNKGTMWIVLALGVGCFACQVLLGFLGGKLRCARLDG